MIKQVPVCPMYFSYLLSLQLCAKKKKACLHGENLSTNKSPKLDIFPFLK